MGIPTRHCGRISWGVARDVLPTHPLHHGAQLPHTTRNRHHAQLRNIIGNNTPYLQRIGIGHSAVRVMGNGRFLSRFPRYAAMVLNAPHPRFALLPAIGEESECLATRNGICGGNGNFRQQGKEYSPAHHGGALCRDNGILRTSLVPRTCCASYRSLLLPYRQHADAHAALYPLWCHCGSPLQSRLHVSIIHCASPCCRNAIHRCSRNSLGDVHRKTVMGFFYTIILCFCYKEHYFLLFSCLRFSR